MSIPSGVAMVRDKKQDSVIVDATATHHVFHI